MAPIILLLLSFNGERFFADAASPLSYIGEKAHPSPEGRFLAVLFDYKSLLLPYRSEKVLGFGLFLSLRKRILLTAGYSYYPKTARSKRQDFLHLSLAHPLSKRPEANFEVKYGFSLRTLSFLHGDPYYSYRINSFHSAGTGLTVTYPLWKFRPYLRLGVSLSYLAGEFIEDIRQRKSSYRRVFFLPKLELGFFFYRFSFEFESAKSSGFACGLHF